MCRLIEFFSFFFSWPFSTQKREVAAAAYDGAAKIPSLVGIFVKKFVKGATPETIAEIEELAAALRDYYRPQSIVEEILLQKIVIETARRGRSGSV